MRGKERKRMRKVYLVLVIAVCFVFLSSNLYAQSISQVEGVKYNANAQLKGYNGQCVSYVKNARPELNFIWGDGFKGKSITQKRINTAKEKGFEVNDIPRKGAAFLENVPTRKGGYIAHTGIVTNVKLVKKNGKDFYVVNVKESNRKGKLEMGTREIYLPFPNAGWQFIQEKKTDYDSKYKKVLDYIDKEYNSLLKQKPSDKDVAKYASQLISGVLSTDKFMSILRDSDRGKEVRAQQAKYAKAQEKAKKAEEEVRTEAERLASPKSLFKETIKGIPKAASDLEKGKFKGTFLQTMYDVSTSFLEALATTTNGYVYRPDRALPLLTTSFTDDKKISFAASKESEVLPTSGIYAYRLLLKTKSPYDGVNYPASNSGNTTLFVNWATGKVYGFSDGDFSSNTGARSANGILKGNVDRTNKRIYLDEWGTQTSYLGTTDDNTHARFITAEDFIINLDRNEIKSGSFNVQWWAGDRHDYNTTGTYSGTSQSFNAAPSVTPDNGEVWKGFAAGVHYNPSNSTFDTLYNTSSNDVYVTFRTSDNKADGRVSVANADSSITELFTFNDYHFVSKDAFGGECSDACGGRVKGFGTTGDSRDYNYISWGKWADEWGAPDEQRIFGVGSYWIVGRLTPYADIPTTGTATYSGEVNGSLINNGTGLFTSLLGTTSLTANFANKAVTGTFDNLKKADGSIWVNQANVNANWGGSNAISGTIAGGGKNGNINGAFFGPQVQEIGGNWTLNGGGDKAAGIFTGKK